MTTNPQPHHQAAELIAGECLAVRVRLLNRTITGIFDDALRPLGLTVGQLNILVVVARRGPVSPGEVAQVLNMEKSTVSRNIERMRTNGWLNVAAPAKGRKQMLTLTRSGERLLTESVPAWEQAQSKARAVLGQRGAASVLSIGNAVWSHIGNQ